MVEVGGGLRTYRVGGRPVIDGYGEATMCDGGRGQPLLPWPNRLGDGRYRWDGATLQLALSEPSTSTAIHGLTRWQRWDVVEATTSSATLAHGLAAHPGYPWALDAAISYRLDDQGLSAATTVVNRSATPAPFGIGFHPYLSAFGSTVDDCTLTVPARSSYQVDDRGLPTGRRPVDGTDDDYRHGRAVGPRHLDLPLADLLRVDGRASVILASGSGQWSTRLWIDEAFTHVQVFSGDTLGDVGRRRRGLAVEPMTGPAGLLDSGDGRITLEPGVAWRATWGIDP